MTPNLKQTREIALVVVLLVVPFFFLRASLDKPGSVTAVDRIFLRVAAPIEYAVGTLARGISDSFQSYVYLVDVKADHEKLAYENARLREAVRAGEKFERENRELKNLLQLKETTPGELVSARVTQKDFSEFFRVARIVLDRGSRELAENLPVISPDGAVGKIISVEGDTASVMLTDDPHFSLDVEDARTHARGMLRGTGDPRLSTCKIGQIQAGDEVAEGDLLLTSGMGKSFPQGIPVARVTKVKQRERGSEQEVEAEPTVKFSRLDWVLVLVKPGSATTPLPAPSAPRPK